MGYILGSVLQGFVMAEILKAAPEAEEYMEWIVLTLPTPSALAVFPWVTETNDRGKAGVRPAAALQGRP